MHTARWFFIFLLTALSSRGEEPVVHMLVPGFRVQELPIKLSNINNLRFSPDGRLTALGYDGRIHLLSDTDKDGLEDTVDTFWDKQTLSVPVGMCWSPEGLYVSSKGKVSLLRDQDGDGKAETEETIASGWPGTDVGSGGVDATAVTRDQDGNIYFGLLTADYSNPYRVTKEGKARYDTNYVRGTIQKWSLKTKTLQTVATGIRVPYTLAFNRAGDLFVTDQEGETWCPGGNPLDELNHIVLGKNYGFPPRHPQHLPHLVSEPPVIGFGPQHQSSCGFTFNEPSSRQKCFGPSWWGGDAFVAGQSRGKIWRVHLVKTAHGYLGKESMIARLSMLTTDVAISPSGDLYVSCHSGPPDWGTGPKGEGKIFKISYVDSKAPQPVYTWAADQMEVRVAFDRPIDPGVIQAITGTEIEFGEYVSAADRYEKLKPPYQIVKQQAATARGKLKILDASLLNKNQILLLKTSPHPLLARYAITIPAIKAPGDSGPGETVDVEYDLNGANGTSMDNAVKSKVPKPSPKVAEKSRLKLLNNEKFPGAWLPHPDASVVSQVIGNFENQKGRQDLKLDRYQIQFKLAAPPNAVRFRFASRKPFRVLTRSIDARISLSTNGVFAFEILRKQLPDAEIISVISEEKASPVSLSYFQENDDTERTVPLSSIFPAWAPENRPIPYVTSERVELTGGDFQRGKNLFFGEKMKCATCHRIRGEGSVIAPDLSNLAHKDVASVLRDIRDPNAAIHPDYTAFNANLRDGETITGFVRSQDETSLRMIGVDGREIVLPRAELAELRASSISLMPEGLLEGVADKDIRDLLVFLTSEPPRRTATEIKAMLNESSGLTTNRVLNVVWVAGKQDHGAGEHDYPAVQKMWLKMLSQSTNIIATNAWQWPGEEEFARADLLIFYFWNKDWSDERLKQIDAFLERGGGIAVLHSATIADKAPEKLAERFGLAAQPVRSKYIHAPVKLKIDFSNPEITRHLPKEIRLLDEPYWPMIGDPTLVKIIASAELDGKAHPQIWTFEKGKGRVFASIMGHYTWTHEDPLYQLLMLRGMAWAAGVEVGHFEKLMPSLSE